MMHFETFWIKYDHTKRKPSLRSPLLIEGLPGIGNVGKIAVDFMIDSLKAKPLFTFISPHFPNTVVVNEENLVEMPRIEMYYVKAGKNRLKQDLLLLAGDIQPTTDSSSFEFCRILLNILDDFNGREIITMGGIGLVEKPKKPRVFITGTSKKIVNKYLKYGKLNPNLYSVVGPIIGITGQLIGLAKEFGYDGVAMLAETLGLPNYLGVDGAKELLKILSKRTGAKFDYNKISDELSKVQEELVLKIKPVEKKENKGDETNYIG